MAMDWNSFALPATGALDRESGVAAFLHAHRDQPVRLDAIAVARLDSLLLQYLVAAARAWRKRGLGFEVTGVRPRLAADFALVGLNPEHLTWHEARA